MKKNNSIISYSSAGEIPPEVIGAFTEFEEAINELQCKVYANSWNRLVHENAPLTAVINGRLMGVPNDFYDFALRATGVARTENVNIIFMDIQMPDISGNETTKVVRDMEITLKRHTPIIATTAFALVGDRQKCIEVGWMII